MTTLASTAFTHRHELTYLRSVSTGWDISQPDAQYGHRHGVCRDCGRDITQLVEAGVKARDNRHPFRTSEELELIEAAHAEALTVCKHCGAAGHFADEPAVRTFTTMSVGGSHGPSIEATDAEAAVAEATRLGYEVLDVVEGDSGELDMLVIPDEPAYDPFAVETWNERL
jgi:hypothetical protein